MEEKQKSQPEISYIGMTRICNECMKDNQQPKAVFDQTFVKSLCKTACRNGVCKLIPKP